MVDNGRDLVVSANVDDLVVSKLVVDDTSALLSGCNVAGFIVVAVILFEKSVELRTTADLAVVVLACSVVSTTVSGTNTGGVRELEAVFTDSTVDVSKLLEVV